MGLEAGELPGWWLRQMRIRKGLSQEELAVRSRLSVRTIGSLERGRTRPHSRPVRLLADTLGLLEEADHMVASYRSSRGVESDADQGHNSSGTAAPANNDEHAQAYGLRAVVPQTVPAGAAHFAGRSAELAILDDLLEGAGGPAYGPGQVAVAAISGAAGVGKTSLAVHWAHRVASRFPDGQLYASLCGFDPADAGTLAVPREVVRAFLGSRDIPAEQIPPEPEALAGLYRSLLAGRRMLIVLDNARDATQVRPLLPGAAGCLVVVTSRSLLAGLAVTHGAQLLHLDALAADEAARLLASRLGSHRVAAETDAAGELAGLRGTPVSPAAQAAPLRSYSTTFYRRA
jgi:transcriptional regulator with XRE-family HTH domain